MVVDFQDVKLITYENTYPSNLAFSLDQPFEWFNCREQFAIRFTDKVEGFFFSHANEAKKGEHIAAFILKTEEILKLTLKNFQHSKFSLTNRPYALWVMPSKFWTTCEIKRSLFTALLRSSVHYDPQRNNYEAALYEYRYIFETRIAVMRFLFGFTDFDNQMYLSMAEGSVGGACGWHRTFFSKNLEQIRNLLRPSPERSVHSLLIGQGAVWN